MSRKAICNLSIVAMLLVSLLAAAAPATAGTNGQQLSLAVSCQYAPGLAEVKVSGYNQRNQYVTWSWSAQGNSSSRIVVTRGYWWVGRVYVQYKYAGINPYTGYKFSWYGTYANVPKSFNRDFYPVAVDWNEECSAAWVP